MDYVIYIMIAVLLGIYVSVLIKYLKTGIFKDKKDKYNIIGIIGYTTQTITVSLVLLLFLLVSKHKQTDILVWLIIVFLLLTIFIYPSYFLLRKKPKKEKKIVEELKEDENEKYGVLEYEKYKIDSFRIPNNARIDDKFNSLISIITNDNMSFIHPKKYKSIKDVFSYLKSEGYIKELDGNHKIEKTITSVNELFKKYGFKVVIKKEDVTNEDPDFIKIRRKDEITTTIYDIYKINELLKKKKKVQIFIGVFIYENDNILDNYLCLVNEKEYKKFFENKNVNQK